MPANCREISARPAAQLADALRSESAVQARDQLTRHQVELLGPHGGGTGDGEDPRALGGWGRRGRYRWTRGVLPNLLHPRERARRREGAGEPVERAGESSRGGSAHAASASCKIAPGDIRRRATEASVAPGTWPRSVVAMMLCPPERNSLARSSRRSLSSSLMTSSSSISGVRWRSLASTARSANSN